MATLILPAEAARILNISERHLRSLTAGGFLKYVNIGLGKTNERLRFDIADIDQFIEERKSVLRPAARSPNIRHLAGTDLRGVHSARMNKQSPSSSVLTELQELLSIPERKRKYTR